jgi:hypothetical protein
MKTASKFQDPRRPFKSRVCSSKLAFSDENIKDCSKEEFEENFKRVSETILSYSVNQKINDSKYLLFK